MVKLKKLENAYRLTPKNDPTDRLEVEIGDTKDASKFYPQVKIKRWSNEVNASFRLLGNEPKQLKTESKKIKLVGAKKEVHLYDIPPCKEHPEGGFEFEVILKEKPVSNKLKFSIETKGLDFFYQPPLTQKELDENCVRSEDVVGSYAVYHSTKQGDYHLMGGKNYRAGKAFHIYRPKVIDSAGNWVWGELNIDVKKKLLTVTIPQEFLNTAVYPIRHAAGATFGFTGIGGTEHNNSGVVVACKFQIPKDGDITSITTYVKASAGSQEHGAAIYSDNGGAINALLAQDSGDVTISSLTWYTNNISYLGVAGTDYWLASWADGNKDMRYDAGGTNQRAWQAGLAFENWPNPFVAGGYTDWKYSIYATYTPIVGGAFLLNLI